MKRIIKLTENDLKRIVRRVLREEEITPESQQMSPEQKISILTRRIAGEPLNFYLIGEPSEPLISQFIVDEVQFGDDMNSIRIRGKIRNPERNPLSQLVSRTMDIDLLYRCQEQDVFRITYKGSRNQMPDNVWRNVIRNFVKKKMEFANVSGRDKDKVAKKMLQGLLSKNPAPLVKPGINENSGKTFLDEIKNIICSTNKMGKAVPKSTESASTNKGFDQNMA